MPTPAPGLTEAFATGLGTMQTDVLGMIMVAAPIALTIAGIFVAIKLGMKFFKHVAK